MRKTVTEEQLAANRCNARKSTGPRTRQGKARSSKNALKHGLLARDVVLTDGPIAENHAEFRTLLADFLRELKPKGPIQQTLVERLAVCDWRLRRAQRYEVRAQRVAMDDAVPADADPVALDKLRRDLDKSQADLREDEMHLQRLHNPPDPADAQANADFHDLVRRVIRSFDLDLPDGPPQELRDTAVDWLQDSAKRCRDRVTDLQQRLADAQSRAQLHRARAAAHSTLPDQTAVLRLVRYESMLDRQFHRALNELRRRQSHSRRSPSQQRPAAHRHGEK